MCEHNLVIGEDYKLTEGNLSHKDCGSWTYGEIRATYLGDYLPNSHRFKPLKPMFCPNCGVVVRDIDFTCSGSSGPIDVTQEFLSLPVRSKE